MWPHVRGKSILRRWRIASVWLVMALFVPHAYADTTFIYSSANVMYGINLTTQQEYTLTTSSVTSSVNALASNSRNALIYYGDESSIYYWDPALGTGANSHASINNFDSGFIQAPIHNLNSAGGSFLDGKYYIGSETDNGFIEELYELTMSSDGRQLVSLKALDIHTACNCSEVQLGGFGDIAVVEEAAGVVIYGSSADLTNNGQGTHAGIWRFELSSGNWTLLADGLGGQMAKALDNRVFTNVGNSIRELVTATGSVSSQQLMSTSRAIWDFTGGFSYDFGDAPDSYGAAAHLVDGADQVVYLGSTPPDNEPYSLHGGVGGVDAFGDNQTGVNDEDSLSALPGLAVGDSSYNFDVACSGGYVSSWIDFNLNGTFDFIERNSNYPVQCTGNVATLEWNGITVSSGGASYARIRIAADTQNLHRPTGFIENGEVEDYDITITGDNTISGGCPAGSTSHIYSANDTPLSYGTRRRNPYVSIIDVPDSLTITDVNLLDLQATHTSQRRLYFLLNHLNDRVFLYGNTCTANTGLDINFDDEASNGLACPPVAGETYRAFNVLSAFDGSDAQGDWQLQIFNFGGQNNGSLRNWALEICAPATAAPVADIRLGKVVTVDGRIATFTILAKNTGNVPLSNINLVDNLDNVFGAGNFQISSAVEIVSAPPGYSINASYTGMAANSLLIEAGGTLQPDEEIQLTFSVEVGNANSASIEIYENQAEVKALTDTGITVSDLSATGLDVSNDVDSPTVFNMRTQLIINGVVFEDTSTNQATSHDGVQQASEQGVSGLGIAVFDVASGASIGTAITTADGSWSASIDPVYTGQQIEVVVTELSTNQFVSESPISTNSVVTDGRVSIVAQANSNNASFNNFVGVGLVKRPALNLDQTASVIAGESTQYAHTYFATTHGSVEFSLDTTNSAQANAWNETLFHDIDCNEQVDGIDNVINGSLNVSFNETVCLIVVVDVPAASLPNESQQLKLSADMYLSDDAVTGHAVTFNNANIDVTNVIGNTAGNLVLEKRVNNLSLAGQAVTQNTAVPGHILEYTIAYSNDGNGPINDLVINDEAPAFTLLQSSSIECSQTPPALQCAPNANGAQIEWVFQGVLPAGASGRVSYQVVID